MVSKLIKIILLLVSLLVLFIINGSNFKTAFTFSEVDLRSDSMDKNNSAKVSQIIRNIVPKIQETVQNSIKNGREKLKSK